MIDKNTKKTLISRPAICITIKKVHFKRLGSRHIHKEIEIS